MSHSVRIYEPEEDIGNSGHHRTGERIRLVPKNTHGGKPANPPMANMDSDHDLDEDREVVDVTAVPATRQPGVDDGFFDEKPHPEQPDVETFNPEIPEREDGDDGDNGDDGDDEEDGVFPRAGGDGDSVKPEDPDGRRPDPNFTGRFPYAPGFGPDLEVGSVFPESIPDVNVYQHKKTLAQGMMDLALFSANANQLRYVLESSSKHPYFIPSLVMISFSLLLQVAVGCGLVWNATYNVKDQKEICIANKINNFTVIGIFLVTVVNVFISAFGVAAPVPVT